MILRERPSSRRGGARRAGGRVAARDQLPGDFRFDNEWSEFADPGAIDRHFRAPRSASNVGLRQQMTMSLFVVCRYLS